MKKLILHLLLFLFVGGILAASVRGLPGNPTLKEMNSMTWKDNGPLELSPERGRYALLYSLVENQSFSFSPDLARFAAPDVGYKDGKYVSLFAPAVSFVVMPGFIIGKYLGIEQVGTFGVIALFALMNVYLIRAIAMRLGAHALPATVGGLVFLFASPAFAYAVTLYQHHISTFLILASIYLLLGINKKKNVIPDSDPGSHEMLKHVHFVQCENLLCRHVQHDKNGILNLILRPSVSLAAIWTMVAFSLSVDYPNAFMMLPIGIAALAKTFPFKHKFGQIVIKIPLPRILAMTAVILPMAFFFWFNQMSYGSPAQLAGTVERSIEVKKDGKPLLESTVYKEQMKKNHQAVQEINKSFFGSFKNRNIMEGFYTHFLSPDRGMILYTPIMFLGVLGLFFASRKRIPYVSLFIAIIGFNVLLYSMWDDPYGGWAFGSRYLIPTYAVLSVFIGIALTRLGRYNLFLLFFFALFTYSTGVNTVGAITSNRNPPRVEAQELSKASHKTEEYTYTRNIDLLNRNISKSYVFERYAANYISAWDYYVALVISILVVTGGLVLGLKQVSVVVEESETMPASGQAAMAAVELDVESLRKLREAYYEI